MITANPENVFEFEEFSFTPQKVDKKLQRFSKTHSETNNGEHIDVPYTATFLCLVVY